MSYFGFAEVSTLIIVMNFRTKKTSKETIIIRAPRFLLWHYSVWGKKNHKS